VLPAIPPEYKKCGGNKIEIEISRKAGFAKWFVCNVNVDS